MFEKLRGLGESMKGDSDYYSCGVGEMGRDVEIGMLHVILFRCRKQQAVIEPDCPMPSYHLLVGE